MNQFRSKNPYTGELYGEYDFVTASELAQQLKKAELAFRHWRRLAMADRQALFLALEQQLLAQKEELALVVSQEMGKPLGQALAEIEKCAWLIRYYVEFGPRMLAPHAVDYAPESRNMVYYEPLGIILQIMPWNFPFWQVLRFSVPTLLAGNVSLLKHAPNVPRSAMAIALLFEQAGFPEGVFQNSFANLEQTAALIKGSEVAGVSLTGSRRAGLAVGALAGGSMKKMVLELGGSDPFIVLEGADLEAAAKAGVQSRFGNNGQTCIAAKRFIVERSLAADFLDAVKAEIAQLRQGDPISDNLDLSCMAREDLALELAQQKADSLAAGAQLLLDGGKGAGSLFSPVILGQAPKGSPAYSEELFGPVLSFFEVADAEEAIQLANDSIYGLGGAIWTDEERALQLAPSLEVGTLAINQLMRSAPHTPFGGVKQSGLGRELAANGIKEFVNVKSILRS
ncbi:aldehyde dehydrogenase family protein [Saprospira grandis]|uniref:aldehyde dehydrogenase family protein n=1 Tax=Saprospira grandis TaxID=1008 RepID=UPI0022DD568F|nr:aldehyde dehydrogenase family protein [Saprospira grandis]WBM75272.1 aldehyde dehydrogenase family protein [Saprospira grandis]